MKSLQFQQASTRRKWSWRFALEDNSTWRSVINLKYGNEDGGWFPSLPKACHVVGLWKKISKEDKLLRQHCFVKLGDGN